MLVFVFLGKVSYDLEKTWSSIKFSSDSLDNLFLGLYFFEVDSGLVPKKFIFLIDSQWLQTPHLTNICSAKSQIQTLLYLIFRSLPLDLHKLKQKFMVRHHLFHFRALRKTFHTRVESVFNEVRNKIFPACPYIRIQHFHITIKIEVFFPFIKYFLLNIRYFEAKNFPQQKPHQNQFMNDSPQ